MVQTHSNHAGHPEKDSRRIGAGAGAGASGTIIPTVPLVEYEALRKQNMENQKVLGEMATLFQQLLPQAQLPPALLAYAQSGGIPEHREAPQQSYHQYTQVPEQLNHPPRQKCLNILVSIPDARVESRRENYHEVVEIMCRGEPRVLPKRAEVELQSLMSVQEAADVKKMIEDATTQNP